LAARLGTTTPDTLGIPVGIQTGQVEIGEFSTVRSDFTAIGGTFTLAARLKSGEILASSESWALTSGLVSKSTCTLALTCNPISCQQWSGPPKADHP